MLKEVIFLVEDTHERGYTAQALGHSIVTEADILEGLKEAVQDAIRCHFEEDERPLPVPIFKAFREIENKVVGIMVIIGEHSKKNAPD